MGATTLCLPRQTRGGQNRGTQGDRKAFEHLKRHLLKVAWFEECAAEIAKNILKAPDIAKSARLTLRKKKH